MSHAATVRGLDTRQTLRWASGQGLAHKPMSARLGLDSANVCDTGGVCMVARGGRRVCGVGGERSAGYPDGSANVLCFRGRWL
jgi:hypothetical protein